MPYDWHADWQLLRQPAPAPHIPDGEETVADSEVERDLGVLMDARLKFRQQAAAAVRKASQVMAVIRRSLNLLDRSTLPMLLEALVQPHLEYGNLVWGRFNRADQRLVERVQRPAIKLVSPGSKTPPVSRATESTAAANAV